MRKLNRWRRKRAFGKAYRILKKESDRHIKANHIMTFEGNSESYLLLRCTGCPNLQP